MSDTSIPQFAELPRLPTGVVCCQNIFAKNSNITINKVHQIIMKIIRECEMNDAVYIVYIYISRNSFVYIVKIWLMNEKKK